MPVYFQLWFYAVMTVLGVGWVVRLVVYYKSASANFFLKKVVLR